MTLTSTRAAEYFLEPSLGVKLTLDDNIRLSIDENESVTGSSVRASAIMGYQSPRTRLVLSPEVEVSRYSEDVGLEGENLQLSAQAVHSVTERTQLSLATSLKDEAIGVEEFNVIGSGFEEIRKTTVSVQPSISHAVTDKLNLQLSYSYQQVDFEESTSTFLNSFTYDQISLSAGYILNSRNQLSATLDYSNYEVPDINFKTVNRSVEFSWTHLFSETLALTAGVGLINSETESSFVGFTGISRNTVSTTGALYNFSAEKMFESSEITISYQRSVSPSSVGDQDVRDNLSLDWKKRFSERFSSSISFIYYSNDSQTGVTQFNNTFDYLQAGATLSYELTEQLSINGGYRYRTVDRENIAVSPESNNIFFGLDYDFDRISRAR